MNSSFPPHIRFRLTLLASHLVVALIALVVIGGATRVMEAGLACPDWPLCYGSFLPGQQMNLKVFLEWFHRLDAFLVGLAILVQLIAGFIWRSQVPKWLLWAYVAFTCLVLLQGGLGALTVLKLLPSFVVMSHMALALLLIAGMSGLTQLLLSQDCLPPPSWWRIMGFGSMIAVFSQSLVGSRMATTWASKNCLENGLACQLLDLHRYLAIPASIFVMTFVFTSLFVGGWPRSQWRLLSAVFTLLVSQVMLGAYSVHFRLDEPYLTIAHQLVAALLVALLSALSFRRPSFSALNVHPQLQEPFMEHCHG